MVHLLGHFITLFSFLGSLIIFHFLECFGIFNFLMWGNKRYNRATNGHMIIKQCQNANKFTLLERYAMLESYQCCSIVVKTQLVRVCTRAVQIDPVRLEQAVEPSQFSGWAGAQNRFYVVWFDQVWFEL